MLFIVTKKNIRNINPTSFNVIVSIIRDETILFFIKLSYIKLIIIFFIKNIIIIIY
jgi:hypothetical protein